MNNIRQINNNDNNGEDDQNSFSSNSSRSTNLDSNSISQSLDSTDFSQNRHTISDDIDYIIYDEEKNEFFSYSLFYSRIIYLCYPSPKLFTKFIYMSCFINIYNLILTILEYLGIFDYDLNLSSANEIHFAFTDNKNFLLKLIKDIIGDLIPNKIKDKQQYISNKSKKLIEILKEEENNPSQKIKALNAIFNLSFYDFLSAYLNDKKKVYIMNDADGKTRVYFRKYELSQDYYVQFFPFQTFKDSFLGNEKQKKEYKEKMVKKLARIMGRPKIRKMFKIRKYK